MNIPSCPFAFCVYHLHDIIVHPTSSCLFHSLFESILPSLSRFLSLMSKYVEIGMNHAEVFLCSILLLIPPSLCLFLSVSSFFSSFTLLLLYVLPPREKGEERHRVIGFPLIARVMLTVHKSCHWNSSSFIFWFCLIVFWCLFPHLPPTFNFGVCIPLCSVPSLPIPTFISPRVSSGSLDCLDGHHMGQWVFT